MECTIAARTALASAIVKYFNYNAIVADLTNISRGTGQIRDIPFRNGARLGRSADAICKRFKTFKRAGRV